MLVFGTYHRDGYGLDYAMNRYYDPARGRFTTADPASSGEISRPNSWNRYSYTEGDPVNYNDPVQLANNITIVDNGGGPGGHVDPNSDIHFVTVYCVASATPQVFNCLTNSQLVGSPQLSASQNKWGTFQVSSDGQSYVELT